MTPTILLATTFRYPSDDSWTVTENGVGRTVTIPAGWYRVDLATGDASSETSAKRLIAALQQTLGANYTVTLRSNAFVQIAWNGAGNAVFSWTNTWTRRMLGFTGDITIPSGGSVIAPYHPQRCLFACAIADDTGWTTRPALHAAATNASGKTFVVTDYVHVVERKFSVRYLPFDWLSRGSVDPQCTPLWGDRADAAVFDRTPSLTREPPYAATQWIADAAGRVCAFALGNWPVPSGSHCDVGYVHAALGDPQIRPSVRGWGALWDLAMHITLIARLVL